MRIAEPAADLAVAAALVSALSFEPVPADTVVFGEIGLSGEIRPVGQADARLKEAAKLGFAAALVPPRRGRGERADLGLADPRDRASASELVARFETQRAPAATPGRRPAMNALDICVVGIIVLSGLFAFARGFVRECAVDRGLARRHRGGALGAAHICAPLPSVSCRGAPIADAAAAGAVFLVTLIVLSIAAGSIVAGA